MEDESAWSGSRCKRMNMRRRDDGIMRSCGSEKERAKGWLGVGAGPGVCCRGGPREHAVQGSKRKQQQQ